jgi:hypothetical protein
MATASSAAKQLAQFAAQARQLRLQANQAPLRDTVSSVKAFQAARLAQTHADLLVHPRYQLAARFFLSDLYGAKNIHQRDAELARVIPVMQKFLPEAALQVMAAATELDALSEQLDIAIAQQPSVAASGGNSLSLDQYQAAYSAVHVLNPSARETQMQLIIRVGRALDGLIRKPMLSTLLKSMGPAATAAGFDHIHDFLTRGFVAFKQMNGAGEFLTTIEARERAYHGQLIVTTDSI